MRAPAHWPPLELRVRVTPEPPEPAEYVDELGAVLRMRSGGSVAVDRATNQATFSVATRPAPRALLHPHLAGVAAVAAHWCGRQSFHAGAFVAAGGVWGLLGEKGSGKSSTLASLARAGVPVVSDDLLVLDGVTALAGPRSIDLRTDAAGRLGIGEPLGVIGERERWRVPLAPIEPELPFRGWVTLSWGEEVVVRPVRGARRLRELLPHSALNVPAPDPLALIEPSSLPVLKFERPREWRSVNDALARLLDALSS